MAQQGYVGRLSPDNNDSRYRIGATLFGVCNSGPATATKVIDLLYNSNENEIDPVLSQGSLINGLTLVVSFAYANTATNVSIQFAGQSDTYTLRGAHNWTSNTILALTYYSGVWSINGYSSAGALYANSLNIKGNLVAGGSVKGSKFIGDVEVPNTKVMLNLWPSTAAQTAGYSTTTSIHWAQVGPLVIIESDGDLPDTPNDLNNAAYTNDYGEKCIVFVPKDDSDKLKMPPPPVSRLDDDPAHTVPGIALTRKLMLGGTGGTRLDPIFAKYRRYGTNDPLSEDGYGQFEVFNQYGHAEPFSLCYIAKV